MRDLGDQTPPYEKATEAQSKERDKQRDSHSKGTSRVEARTEPTHPSQCYYC